MARGQKYEVRRIPHGDLVDALSCFVLLPGKDRAARAAIAAYAEATDDHELAADLRAWLDQLRHTDGQALLRGTNNPSQTRG